MKRVLLCAVAAGVLIAGCFAAAKWAASYPPEYDIIRIHIRANSNSDADQNVKFKVKDAVVAYLEPKLNAAASREEAERTAKAELAKLSSVAEEVLRNEGFSYSCKARLAREEFPTRSYDGIVFESGNYTALVLELGTGEGNNWWCVMYPPLCFINAEYTGESGVEYRSLIMEWLEKLKTKR